MDLEIITSILIIIGIDIVLGGDNAIVIALACRNLPEHQRNKAIVLGTIFAVIVRVMLTIIALYLLKIPFLQFVGGCFLILIAYKLLTDHGDETSKIRSGITLYAAVRTIVVADLVMGIDNVIAVAGAAHGKFHLVIIGLLISIPIIIWGSKLILFLMERVPLFIYIGAGILGFTAGKMIVHEDKLSYIYNDYPFAVEVFPFVIVIVVIAFGYLSNKIRVSISM
jgi:YjbE family integral membrane protein